MAEPRASAVDEGMEDSNPDEDSDAEVRIGIRIVVVWTLVVMALSLWTSDDMVPDKVEDEADEEDSAIKLEEVSP